MTIRRIGKFFFISLFECIKAVLKVGLFLIAASPQASKRKKRKETYIWSSVAGKFVVKGTVYDPNID